MDYTVSTVDGNEMRTYSLTDGCYATKWGVADFYDDAEANLRELLTYTGEFRTDWCDCKKELYTFQLTFSDDGILVHVGQWMDDLNDLIYDALYDLDMEDVEISYTEEREILDLLYEADAVTETYVETIVKRDLGFDGIVETLEHLANETDETLKDEYEKVKNIIYYYMENRTEKENEE